MLTWYFGRTLTFCLIGVSMTVCEVLSMPDGSGRQPAGETTLNMGTPGCSRHTSLMYSQNGRLNSFTEGWSVRQRCLSGTSIILLYAVPDKVAPGTHLAQCQAGAVSEAKSVFYGHFDLEADVKTPILQRLTKLQWHFLNTVMKADDYWAILQPPRTAWRSPCESATFLDTYKRMSSRLFSPSLSASPAILWKVEALTESKSCLRSFLLLTLRMSA